jgi:hypothetical protein
MFLLYCQLQSHMPAPLPFNCIYAVLSHIKMPPAACFDHRLQHCSPRHLALFLTAFARLSAAGIHSPSKLLLAAWLGASQHQLQYFSVLDAVQAVQALGCLQVSSLDARVALAPPCTACRQS